MESGDGKDRFKDVRDFLCKWRAEKNLKMCAGRGKSLLTTINPLKNMSQGELLFISLLAAAVLLGIGLLVLRRRGTREETQLLDRSSK
jgi:hypothetical protein